MKKNKCSLLCYALLLFLGGCMTTSYKVELNQKVIEYTEAEIDVCGLIKKVDKQSIREHKRAKNRIKENGYDITCANSNVRKLGKQESTIQVNGIDVVINYRVEDTTPPTIQVKSDLLEVEKGNTYFDISNLIEVVDNYDSDPLITFTGDYDLGVVGEYEVNVSAKDSNKNHTSKQVKVRVTKDKKVEIIEKIIVSPPAPELAPQKGNTSSGVAPYLPPSSLSQKSWMFVSGFDLLTGYDACMSYKGLSPGACQSIIGPEGIPVGYEYLP